FHFFNCTGMILLIFTFLLHNVYDDSRWNFSKTTFAILEAFGVNPTAILAGAGILSLVIGLGAQPLIEDIIAGLFIIFENVFDVGDIIVIDGYRGAVKEIGIRTTKIEDTGGNIKVVNNSDIKNLVNMSDELSLAISEIQIEYGESIERVEAIINENLDAIKEAIPAAHGKIDYVGVSQLASSGVTLRFWAHCKEKDIFQVQRDLNRQLKLMFDRNKINVPFPQVVVHDAKK
ncbi:MAG: mechanosensitive ion channel family protein, partial [Eggerthellaceae bacterium]|nr:mechanosensitive ion channel family protein [Eggerthellaceae bacterium]